MAVGLRLNGQVVGVNPAEPVTVYVGGAGRTAIGAWEEVKISPHPNDLFDVRFLAANRTLTLTPWGTLETRPPGTFGEWEQFKVNSATKKLFRAATLPSFDIEGWVQAPLIHLERRGNDFVDASGERMVIPALDQFPAFRLYRDNGPDALAPLFEESTRLGFKAWRMWSQGSKKQNTFLDLSPKESGYYDDIRPCTDLLNSKGIIPLWTIYLDNQDLASPLSHWSAFSERLVGSSSLLSGFNQWSKNKSTFDPWALPDPGHGLIWSRGSDIEDTETEPRGAPASELHATRNSFERALMDATASPPEMRKHGSSMVWMTEGNPFGDSRAYSEFEAWKLGRAYSIEWALAVYHNRQSQFGKLMEDGTAKSGAAWVKGMRL